MYMYLDGFSFFIVSCSNLFGGLLFSSDIFLQVQFPYVISKKHYNWNKTWSAFLNVLQIGLKVLHKPTFSGPKVTSEKVLQFYAVVHFQCDGLMLIAQCPWTEF